MTKHPLWVNPNPWKMAPPQYLWTGARLMMPINGPPWLAGSVFTSTPLAKVTLLGYEGEWIGQAGSGCLKTVMISAALRGVSAVMTMHDPDSPGLDRFGPRVLAMTLAYAAHLDSRGVSWTLGHRGPELVRLGLLDPDRWACMSPEVSMPDEERVDSLAHRAELLAFIADPASAVGPTLHSTTWVPRDSVLG